MRAIKISRLFTLGLLVLIAFLLRANVNAASNPIANGYYMIVSGSSDDRVLDINHGNMNNGGNLEIYSRDNSVNQRFYIRHLNNGYYSIQALHSGKYLHIQDENNRQSNVHQWEGYTHNNAQWALVSAGDGYYYLRNRGNGSYLDNSGGHTSLANNVISYPLNKGSNQKWRFVSTATTKYEKRTISDGLYTIESGNTNSRVLDINNLNMNNGGNLEIYQKNNGANQKFYVTYMGNGYYTIRASHSGRYIHVQGGGKTPANVHQWEGTGINGQWSIEPAGGNYYYLRCKSGNYLDNSNGSTANGNNVISYYFNASAAQKWKFVPTTKAVTYETYYVTTTAGLFLRKGPGTSYGKVISTAMPYGSVLQVSSISNGWAKVKYSSYEGYCSTTYISKSKPETGIALAVPTYRQYDSKWGNVKIGTKTISQIGCTTCALAMKYSYQTNTSTTPDRMKGKLSYSNNDIIWSSVTRLGYTVSGAYNTRITNSIMTTIYNQLKNKRPVIVGGIPSASSSSQHWIIVTGYKGKSTSSFSASDFTIIDPNNSGRTNLQHFLNYKPYVHKLIY